MAAQDTGFVRPSLQALINRNIAAIETNVPGADAHTPRGTFNALAYIMAGASHELHGRLDFIARQAFPDTAEAEYMDRWAGIFKVTRKASVKAAGTITITGIDGTLVAEGSKLTTQAGVQYQTTANATIASGSAVVGIEAVQAGSAGNLPTTSTLTFVSPNLGADAEAAASVLAGGTDTESDAALLVRLLDRIQTPPQGGAAHDYIAWAMAVPGVTRAWVYEHEMGIGTVTVRFMTDDTTDDGIPESAMVTFLNETIDVLRPLGCQLYVAAPVADPLDFDLRLKNTSGVVFADATIQAAVEAQLADLIQREAEPGKTLPLTRIHEAISQATGEYDHVINDPTGNVTHTTGHIATVGTFTWS